MHQFLTCKFKIHNPSRYKRNVIEHALCEYTLAYQRLLDYAYENLEMIRRDGLYKQYDKETGELKSEKYTGKSIAACLPRIEVDLHSSAKDSLIQDVAGNLASYLELEKAGAAPSFPKSRNLEPQVSADALDYFVKCGASLEDYNESKREYLRVDRIRYMPLYFTRADGVTRNRNFSIVTNGDGSKLFAVLYLLPNNHELGKPLQITDNALARIDTGEVFNSKSKCAIMVPLEVGRNGWQLYKFLQPAQRGQAVIKTAELSQDGDDFYLHVVFAFEVPDTYKPEAYLGVDRGVFYSMAYAIVDKQGGIIKMDENPDGFRGHVISASKRVQAKQQRGQKVNMRDYRRKEGEAILHNLINHIIEDAKQHQALIVMEDLNIKIQAGFYKSAWANMHRIMEYKCRLEGVPFRRGGTWAAYSSQICIYCGALNEERKRDGSPFVCPECGATYHSDAGAGVNIARRMLYKKKQWDGRGGYRAFHRTFSTR